MQFINTQRALSARRTRDVIRKFTAIKSNFTRQLPVDEDVTRKNKHTSVITKEKRNSGVGNLSRRERKYLRIR